VLLIMDSLTVMHGATRNCAGDWRASCHQGLPASVFAKLPQLVERAGNGTEVEVQLRVLYRADGRRRPAGSIADSARAILDGHIVLSRRLAEQGITGHRHRGLDQPRHEPPGFEQKFARFSFQAPVCHYQRNHDLISVARMSTAVPLLDEGIAMYRIWSASSSRACTSAKTMPAQRGL